MCKTFILITQEAEKLDAIHLPVCFKTRGMVLTCLDGEGGVNIFVRRSERCAYPPPILGVLDTFPYIDRQENSLEFWSMAYLIPLSSGR